MDRAHRLGQTRTVSVYRLIMRATLEEKIMGLQRFKLDVASAVVNSDNMSLSSMDTSQLLDLFVPPGGAAKGAAAAAAGGATGVGATGEVVAAGAGAKGGAKKSGLQAVLEGLGELWDEQQYEQQFDVRQFAQKLRKQP
jgi:TATA-binding protein-associated factor